MGLRYPLAAALGVLLLGGGVALGHAPIAGPTASVNAADAAIVGAAPQRPAPAAQPAVAGPRRQAAVGPRQPGAAAPRNLVASATPTGTPASTPAAGVPGLAPFVGTWRVHGAELTIGPDGTATELIQLGPCRGISVPVRCTATATLKVDLSPGAPHLLYTGFRYTGDDGATVVPDSLDGLPRVGDGYRVRAFAPGVIELIPLTEHLREILGSPYRCNTEADEYARQRLCNA